MLCICIPLVSGAGTELGTLTFISLTIVLLCTPSFTCSVLYINVCREWGLESTMTSCASLQLNWVMENSWKTTSHSMKEPCTDGCPVAECGDPTAELFLCGWWWMNCCRSVTMLIICRVLDQGKWQWNNSFLLPLILKSPWLSPLYSLATLSVLLPDAVYFTFCFFFCCAFKNGFHSAFEVTSL